MNKTYEISIRVVHRPLKQCEENYFNLYEEIKSLIVNREALIIGDFNNLTINWDVLACDLEGNRLID